MDHTTYPNLRQSLLLVFYLFASFAVFFFVTGALPQIVGWPLSKSYLNFIIAVASPICTIPLIIYVSRKSGIPVKWKVKLPGIRLVFFLILLTISGFIITRPFINPVDFLNNLMDGKLEIVVIKLYNLDLDLVIRFIGAALIAPIFEEIFWRKQIFGLLLKKYSPVVSIVLSSVFFACGHGRLNDIGLLFIWGLLFCIVYYKTNSLEASILIHSLGNAFSFFTNYEYIENTTQHLFYYISILAGSIVVIYLIIIYLGRHRLPDPETGSNEQKI
jgi:membrane protease YdiL (CAAX protease family)